LVQESLKIKYLQLTNRSSKEPVEILVIGTILPESLLSLVTVLKFGSVNPAPDMTKRMTALKLITKGSWPPTCYSNL